MGLEQIFIVSGSDKNNQTSCHIYDRIWLCFEGIHSLEEGPLIWEGSSVLEKCKDLWPFRLICTVKG